MSQTLRTALYVLLFAFIIQMQFNLDADKTATRQLKNAIELAVHDAALAIDFESLKEGKIIFDEDQALKNLKQSIEKNLNVTGITPYRYIPKDNTFYHSEISIVFITFIDDRTPRNYPIKYNNLLYKITETVEGPCVIAVIETESPRWFSGGTATIRQAAVYEYKKK